MTDINNTILAWFRSGSDFDKGIILLRQVSRNTFYINNILRSRRDSSLRYELGKVLLRAGVPGSEFRVSSFEFRVSGSGFGVSGSPLYPSDISPEGTIEEKKHPSVSLVPKGDNLSKGSEGTIEEKKEEVRGVVLREEFPFLAAPDCPDELKVLVSDMITSHSKYVSGHSKLFDVAHKGNVACFNAAKLTVESFLDNRSIWKELEHYKKTKKILGEHPVFKLRRKREELKLLNSSELKRRLKNLKRQLSYRNGLIKQDVNNKYVRLQEIKDIKSEMAMVETLIKGYVGREY